MARGYTKALSRARKLVYIEDQYLWGQQVGDVFTEALRRNPGLHVIAVVPLFTDQDGVLARNPQMLGRARAMQQMTDVAPDRVAIYGIENHHGHSGLRARQGVRDGRRLGHRSARTTSTVARGRTTRSSPPSWSTRRHPTTAPMPAGCG